MNTPPITTLVTVPPTVTPTTAIRTVPVITTMVVSRPVVTSTTTTAGGDPTAPSIAQTRSGETASNESERYSLRQTRTREDKDKQPYNYGRKKGNIGKMTEIMKKVQSSGSDPEMEDFDLPDEY